MKEKKRKVNVELGMSQIIEDFLFLGSGLDANDVEQIKRMKIDVILNVTTEWQLDKLVGKEIKEFKRLELKDTEEQSSKLEELFESTFEYIDQIKEKKQRILVHW